MSIYSSSSSTCCCCFSAAKDRSIMRPEGDSAPPGPVGGRLIRDPMMVFWNILLLFSLDWIVEEVSLCCCPGVASSGAGSTSEVY